MDRGLTKLGVRGEGDVLELDEVTGKSENGIRFATRVGVSGVARLALCDEVQEEKPALDGADLEFGRFADDDGLGVPVLFVAEERPGKFGALTTGFFFGTEEEGQSRG